MPDNVAASILRLAIEEGTVNVVRHGSGYIGVKIAAEFYATSEQADLLDRLLNEEAVSGCDKQHWTEDEYGNEIRIDCGNGCEY